MMLFRLIGLRPKSYTVRTRSGQRRTIEYAETVVGAVKGRSEAEAVARFCESFDVNAESVRVRCDDSERQRAFEAFGI